MENDYVMYFVIIVEIEMMAHKDRTETHLFQYQMNVNKWVSMAFASNFVHKGHFGTVIFW